MEKLEDAQKRLSSVTADLDHVKIDLEHVDDSTRLRHRGHRRRDLHHHGRARAHRRAGPGRPAGPVRQGEGPVRRACCGRPPGASVRGLPAGDQRRRPPRDRGQARRRGAPLPRVQPHPRPHGRVRPVSRRVIVEADGGSRGNPGPAAYGALVRDADTGEVIAERGESIGVATNNVAEYRGLIAGLELVREHAPDAEVEVRMDSKLVVEQMAGRWKIKHVDMKPLALRGSTAGVRQRHLDVGAASVEQGGRRTGERGARLGHRHGPAPRQAGTSRPAPEARRSQCLMAQAAGGDAHHGDHASARRHQAHPQEGVQRTGRRRPRPHRSRS